MSEKNSSFFFFPFSLSSFFYTNSYPRGVGPVLYDLMAELAPSNRRIRSIEAGANHIVALDSSGEIYTWGFGDRGQLGHSNFRSKIRPEKMASSAFSAAVTVDKVGKGGTNGSGRRQFSYSSGSPYSGTVRGALSHRVSIRQIACGEDHSVALTEEGAVFTWGDNSRGQLGHGDGTITNCSSGGNGGGGGGSRMAGTNEDCPQPRLVQGLLRRKVAEIAAGGHHTLALVVAGSLYTWGSGEQLGLGAYAGNGDMNAPQAVKTMAKFRLRHIDCGVDWSVALSHSGDVYTWGANHNGQLGVDDCRRRLVRVFFVLLFSFFVLIFFVLFSFFFFYSRLILLFLLLFFYIIFFVFFFLPPPLSSSHNSRYQRSSSHCDVVVTSTRALPTYHVVVITPCA